MPIAFNPETGDALVLFDNEWVKPEKIAQNDKGEIAYLLNNEWVMPGQEPKPKEIEPETSTMGAIGRGVMRGALPSAAGIVAGGAGAVLGTGAGPVGTVVGGLGAGFAGSAAMSAAQEKFLEDNPDIAKTLGLDKETLAKDEKSHPYASFAGELLPNMLALRPSGALLRSGKGLTEEAAKRLTAEKVAAGVNATIGSSVGAGMQVGQEAMGDEPIDWTKVGIAGLAGALGHKETALGRSLSRVGELPASAASKAAVRALRRPGEVTPEMMAEPSIKAPEEFVGGVPKSASQDTEAMMADLEGRAPIEAAKPITEPLAPEAPITPKEVKAAEEAVAPTKPEAAVAPETVVKTQQPMPHPYESELKDLYKQRDVLAKEKDDLNLFLRKRGIHPKEKADMGIEKGAKDYPYLFRKDAQGLDVLMHDAIEHGIISESDLAHYSDPVEGFREMAKAAIDGQTANTPKNMETIAKMEAVQSRIEHLESIPKEEYGLKAESPAEAQARMDKELAARKAQEDASVQADMEAQAAKDKAEIARRSEEQAKNFALGQTPEESLTGQGRLIGPDEDIPFEIPAAHTEKFAGDAEVLGKNLRTAMDQMGLKNVGLTLADSLNARVAGKMESVNGAYLDKMIHLSLNGDNIHRTMNHEALHAMKDHGFFTDKDWNILANKANKEWMQKYGIEKDYGHLSKDLQHEEAIAKAFADYRTQPPKVKSIMAKAMDVLKRIGNVLRGKGYKKAEDIFKSAGEGKLRATKEPSAGPSYELKAPETPEFKSWFSNSKVVNEDGSPKVMYHGTTNFEEIDGKAIFKPNKKVNRTGNIDGYYFTTDPKEASEYSTGLEKDVLIEGSEVIPAYLSIKNPFVKGSKVTPKMIQTFKDEVIKSNSQLGERAKEYAEDKAEIMKEYGNTGRKYAPEIFPNINFSTAAKQRVLKAGGYDGFQDGGSHWVAFDSNQIKSAFNKTPTENPDIRFEMAKKPVTAKNVVGENVGATWEAPPVTKFTEFTRLFQNKHVDLKRTVEAIKKQIGDIEERYNPYQKEGLFHSKVANRSRVFLESEIDPLVKKMVNLKVTNDELHDYLYNRHAEEYNKQMNKINPDIVTDDGSVIPYKLKDRASGIHTDEARKYFDNLDPKKKADLDNVAKDMDKIIEGTQKLLVESGQEKQETIDAWNRTYKHYAPMFREMEANKMSTLSKRGMGVSGSFSKRAMGSEREVADIANSIIGQREKAIEIAEKMEVDHALYGLAIKAPNPEVWLPVSPKAIKNPELLARELDAMGLDGKDIVGMMQERKTRVIEPDPATGLDRVVYKTNPLERYKDNVLPIRINGEDSFIFFNKDNPLSANMVKAFHNMDTPTIGLVGKQIGKATQWMAKVNTQWNPVFGGLNFMRDFSSAMANLSSTELKGEQAKIAGGIKPAMAAIWKTMRAERSGEPLPNTAEAKLYQEFREHGGQTLYREQLIRRADQENLINEKIKQLNSNVAKKAASGFFNGLSDFNDTIENAIRLSAYKAAKEKGMSAEKAATIAKELTVNFDRKGAMGQQINNYFAFFNASAQGVARMGQTLKGPAGKKIIMGGIGLGALQAGMMEMAGFDDNDPPEFVKSRNFIIPTMDGKYLAIPYPLGLHFLPNIGRIAVEAGLHGDVMKHAGNMAAVVADSFNPLGGGNISLQTIAPTVLDPAVAIATNKDAFGRPISKEDRSTSPTTGLSRSREQSTAVNKAVAEAINYITGGTKDTKGFLSPTADQLDYLAGQVTGGAGREVIKIGKTAGAIAKGKTDELASYDIPLAGRFYGDTKSPAANSQHFYDNVTKLAEHEAVIKGMRQRHENVADYMRENPESRLWQQANNVENQISALNKQKKQWIERDIPEERIKSLDDRKQAIMTRFNERVKSLK